jgi:hypothetical protein
MLRSGESGVGHALKGSWGANLVQYFSESRHGTVRDVGFAPEAVTPTCFATGRIATGGSA